MKPLRVLALVDRELVPPEQADDETRAPAPWKAEYDVVRALRSLGHEVSILGVGSDLGAVRLAIQEFKPDIAFNLLECFDGVATWDHNVVAFLELSRLPYSGCNARGLLLARDKALAKKLLAFHRVATPDFAVCLRGRAVRRPKRLAFPLIVKSLTLDASIGISQASVVDDEARLEERVRFVHESTGTDAIVEQYIEGRELYVGILGNHSLRALPTWELSFEHMPEDARKIATERVKWNPSYQKRHGIASRQATDLDAALERRIVSVCRRVHRSLMLSGYARIDLRLTEAGQIYVMEANPNPHLAMDEDFARSAAHVGLGYEALIARILSLGLKWEPGWLG
jgi:D-alanine-D-alanine ligase